MRKFFLFLNVVLIPLSIVMGSYLLPVNQVSPSQEPYDLSYQEIVDYVDNISLPNIINHCSVLSGLGSRVSGYPGSLAAANYIYETLKAYGLSDAQFESFNVTSPIDYGAEVTVLQHVNASFKAYTLWPNDIATGITPLEGLVGHLVYVGEGRLTDLDGKDLNESIVLMEFNTMHNWANAAMLGAKGLIFILPEETTGIEVIAKSADVPVSIPRVVVESSDGMYLRELAQGNPIVSLKVKMVWEMRTAQNIIASVPGTTYPEEIMYITSNYDSMSWIPSLSPGAGVALGVSALLELAALYQSHPSKYTVKFIATGASNRGLLGAREYVYQHQKELENSRIAIDLHFTTDSQELSFSPLAELGVFPVTGQGFQTLSSPYGEEVLEHIFGNGEGGYLLELNETVPGISRIAASFIGGEKVYRYIGIGLAESDPFAWVNGVNSKLTIQTIDSHWLYYGSPSDTFDRQNFENLKPQMEVVFSMLKRLLDEDHWHTLPKPKPRGFTTTKVSTLEYDVEEGRYKPLPNVIIHAYPHGAGAVQWGTAEQPITPSIRRFWLEYFFLTDDKGEATIRCHPYWFITATGGIGPSFEVRAGLINSTGHMIATNGYGRFALDNAIGFSSLQNYVNIVLFKCGSMAFYGLQDPEELRPYMTSPPTTPLTPQYTYAKTIIVSLNDFNTHVTTESYFYAFDTMKGILWVAVPPNLDIEVLVSAIGDPYSMFLINADEEHPSGKGYRVGEGGLLTITKSQLRLSFDMYLRADGIVKVLSRYNIFSPHINFYYEEAANSYQKSLEAYNKKLYSVFYVEAYNAWNYAKKTYFESRRLYMGVMQTAIVVFMLLVPFAFVTERLLFNTSGVKRILAILLMFIIPYVVIFTQHPAFALASNAFILQFATPILVLSIPILFIFLSELTVFMGIIRKKIMGPHFAEISRLGAITMALFYGIQHMRRHKFRTILNLLVITVVTYSFISLSSLQLVSQTRYVSMELPPIRDGLLIEMRQYYSISPEIRTFIESEYPNETTVLFRSWSYGGTLWGFTDTEIRVSDAFETIDAIVGLQPGEEDWLLNKLLIEEGGRFFVPGEANAILLSNVLASSLGVKPGDSVRLLANDFTVVGVFDASSLNAIVDLDGAKITPLDPVDPLRTIHLSATLVVIIPFEQTLRIPMDAQIHQIVVNTQNPDIVWDIASNLVNRLSYYRIEIYGQSRGETRSYSQRHAYALLGWSYLVIPYALSMLIIVNTLISNVVEREREIYTFSYVGLSPMHITAMFFTESLVYALIGAMSGYVAGICGTSILYGSQRLVPAEFSANYASTSVIIVLVLSISTVLVSTIYPAFKASKLVTPSLERAWKMPTKPLGDSWAIPLPFQSLKEECKGILSYMKEYLNMFKVEGEGPFMIKDLSYSEEDETLKLNMVVRLPPLEAGTEQKATLTAAWKKELSRYTFEILVERLSGEPRTWKRGNKVFVNELRKQLLIWRSLKEDEKMGYIKRKP